MDSNHNLPLAVFVFSQKDGTSCNQILLRWFRSENPEFAGKADDGFGLIGGLVVGTDCRWFFRAAGGD